MTLAEMFQRLNDQRQRQRPVGQASRGDLEAFRSIYGRSHKDYQADDRQNQLRLLRLFGAGPQHAVGQANQGSLDAYRSITGMSHSDMARREGRLPPVRTPMPEPYQTKTYFGNDWSGMQRAVGNQRQSDARGWPSLAALLGGGGGY